MRISQSAASDGRRLPNVLCAMACASARNVRGGGWRAAHSGRTAEGRGLKSRFFFLAKTWSPPPPPRNSYESWAQAKGFDGGTHPNPGTRPHVPVPGTACPTHRSSRRCVCSAFTTKTRKRAAAASETRGRGNKNKTTVPLATPAAAAVRTVTRKGRGGSVAPRDHTRVGRRGE